MTTNEEVCEITDLPRIMCAHCSGKVGEVEAIGTYTPPSGESVTLRAVDLSGYRALPYYPKPVRRASGVDGGRVCRCGQPCGDQFVCPSCADDLDRCLGDVPALVEDLELAACKLDRVMSWPRAPRPKDSPSLLEKSVRDWMFDDSDRPLDEEVRARTMRILGRGRPDNPSPAAARDQLTRALVTAVAIIEPTTPGPHDAVTMSRWLLRHLPRVVRDPQAPGIVEQIVKTHDKCMRLIDSAPDRTFYGYCRIEIGDGLLCDTPVSIPDGADSWTCACGYVYEVEVLEGERIDRARGQVLTVAELAEWTGDPVRTVRTRLRRRGVLPVGSRFAGAREVQMFEASAYLDIRHAAESA